MRGTKQIKKVEQESSNYRTTSDGLSEKTMDHPIKQDKTITTSVYVHSKNSCGSQSLLSKQTFKVKPYLFGVITAAGVIGFYLGLLTMVSDWNNATSQFGQYWGWIIALALGLGVQASLFFHIKDKLKGQTITVAKSSMAASGGVSTASMAACCAHYLVAFLPAFGLPLFSAVAAGLVEYQMEFLLLGVISNIFGIFVIIRTMSKNGLIPAGFLARSLTIGL